MPTKDKNKNSRQPSAAVADLANQTAPAATPGEVALFFTGGNGSKGIDFARIRATRLNAPRMLLPKDMPVGAQFVGEITKVGPSPALSVKGRVLWLKTKNGTEFLFPIVGSMRQALVQADLLVTKEVNGETQVLVEESTKKLAGKWIGVERQPDGKTMKFCDDAQKAAGGKKMYLIDVYLLNELPQDEATAN